MNISNVARVNKLIVGLISKPDLIWPYFRTSILSKKFPIDHELPWWSFRAIEYADSVLQGKKIFEFGTGGSTLRYSKICESIIAVEDDLVWLNIVRNRLDSANVSNVTLHHHEFDFDNPIGFTESDYLKAYKPEYGCNVVIIDGQDKTFRERIECFRFVEPHIPPGGIIVVDDWWRYTELFSSNNARDVKIFESVGPCRFGVTSTAFFHY